MTDSVYVIMDNLPIAGKTLQEHDHRLELALKRVHTTLKQP